MFIIALVFSFSFPEIQTLNFNFTREGHFGVCNFLVYQWDWKQASFQHSLAHKPVKCTPTNTPWFSKCLLGQAVPKTSWNDQPSVALHPVSFWETVGGNFWASKPLWGLSKPSSFGRRETRWRMAPRVGSVINLQMSLSTFLKALVIFRYTENSLQDPEPPYLGLRYTPVSF